MSCSQVQVVISCDSCARWRRVNAHSAQEARQYVATRGWTSTRTKTATVDLCEECSKERNAS